MGLFGGGNKVVKPFQSNNKLVEIITSYDPDSKGLTWTEVIEKEVEKRYLYRNVETISFGGDNNVIVKYKDLKVHSESEVAEIRRQLRKEAGLE